MYFHILLRTIHEFAEENNLYGYNHIFLLNQCYVAIH